MHSFIQRSGLLAAVGILAAACASAATPAPIPTPTPAPTASPAPTMTPVTPAPTARQVATPAPRASTDGQGDEHVIGTETVAVGTQSTTTQVGDVSQQRGGVVDLVDTMNDPRVTGKGTMHFSADLHTKVAPEWGQIRLENAGGAWEGTCTGGAWDAGDQAMGACWLVGSGGYKGFTYYRVFHWGPDHPFDNVEGVVFPGSPPKP
ncbi:MAG: hypothetical protein L3K06_07735 [Thermoplasmata archaeon]|nr:hypothetical protein [Thermoplasmata archaeon]